MTEGARDPLFPADPLTFCMSITPFTADGAIDEDALRDHLRRIVAAGLGVYVGSPGSGEGHALSVDEHRLLYRIGVDECGGRVPVFANPRESRDVAGMLEIAGLAIAAGVDAVQIYQIDGGHGFHPTPGELEAYFRDVIEAIDHPVVLGCNPVAGYLAPPEVLAGLAAELPQIVGLNIVETSTAYLTACRDAMPDLRIFVGQTGAVQGFALGANGVLSASANVIPRTCATIDRALADSDLDALRTAVPRVQRFHAAFVESMAGARWEKLVLHALGLPGGNGVIRRPYLFPDADAQRDAAAKLAVLGVREWEELGEA